MGRRRISLLGDSSNGRWGKKAKENNKQALAEIGQGHLIALWDSLFGRLNQPIAQILFTRGDLADRSRHLNASSTLTTQLNHGIILIINKNNTLSVAKIKFIDNDTLSTITPSMCHAESLFLMTDVDFLYTENPLCSSTASSTHPPAALLGPPQPNPSPLAYETKPLYTFFLPPNTPLTSQKVWVSHGLVPKGSVGINKGAYRAISCKSIGRRLLPAGVVQAYGKFAMTQAVNIMLPQAYLNPALESHNQKMMNPVVLFQLTWP
ncbi:hypothetical protein O181_033137 [Austropuccinia psidii MF-1]|uniref:Aspartate/glutamate/uridylate kinase domain-containing protein n=1 Tax=Austropuccinia psidii MF-1 TaxID=1389203 RepID=A0A9Q3H6W2_9BASI|nr:hypothetical protein [Austropuccinia psidii MF-1]